MSSNNTNNSIGFFGLLTLIFVTLKLCQVITWSWWLVLLPLYFWIPALIFLWLLVYFIALFFLRNK